MSRAARGGYYEPLLHQAASTIPDLSAALSLPAGYRLLRDTPRAGLAVGVAG